MELEKNKQIKKIEKKKKREEKITPLKQEDKRLFSKIRNAVKKQK